MEQQLENKRTKQASQEELENNKRQTEGLSDRLVSIDPIDD